MKGSCISMTWVVLSPSLMFFLAILWFKKAQGCASFEIFPREAPVRYLSTPFPCLPQDLPMNYKHRCARFHFAPLLLCLQLLYFSYSKWRGPQDPVLGLQEGQSRTGPCVGVSNVVIHPPTPPPNLKTYLKTSPALSRNELLWESNLIWPLTHTSLFITVSYNSRISYDSF